MFDTNILIDCLRGHAVAAEELERWSEPAISIVSWIEVLAGTPEEVEAAVRNFLAQFAIVPLSPETAELSVRIRRELRLKLPDAVILATSQLSAAPLISRDRKAFGDMQGVRIPYILDRPS